jgi:hypothetical protein
MLAVTDYVGLGTLIAAISASIVSIIVAIKQQPIATKVNDVHAAVTVSNGHTIGELVEKNEIRHEGETRGT